eukprot:6176727-Pleurochrysis_carterae.AAC.2
MSHLEAAGTLYASTGNSLRSAYIKVLTDNRQMLLPAVRAHRATATRLRVYRQCVDNNQYRTGAAARRRHSVSSGCIPARRYNKAE